MKRGGGRARLVKERKTLLNIETIDQRRMLKVKKSSKNESARECKMMV